MLPETGHTPLRKMPKSKTKGLTPQLFGIILEVWKIAIQGEVCDLKNDERVRAAYLGGAKIVC
ncbi:MAG: hypothetical protein NTV33_07890 [Coprothermobacterota bacterium]|nr:hypothetical protein [Coprothermobacterota bacterium]